MNDLAYRELLDLLMCSDPEPCEVGALKRYADAQAKERGYGSWIVAYHDLTSEDPSV